MNQISGSSQLARIESNSAEEINFSSSLNQYSPNQTEIKKQQAVKELSDAQQDLFTQVCKRTGLDPATRQIYCIMRRGNPTIQVSIDGFRTVAARSGLYGGSSTEWCGADGVWKDVWLSSQPPSGAKTTVYRLGCPNPFTGVARYAAYQQNTDTWRKMPDVMIGKCSEALALRKAFPAELSGLYSTEEMEQADKEESKIDFSHYAEELKTLLAPLHFSNEDKQSFAKSISPLKIATWGELEWKVAIASANKLTKIN